MKFLIFLAVLPLTFSYALEVDERLTLRILKASSTKKTILINRGLEDGLVVGDHAKFFLTNGVIARGVVEKTSPTRSIWSLYRIIDGTDIVNDKVMKLKISTPLKVTEDPTKSLVPEPVVAGRERIRVRGGELDINDSDFSDLKDLKAESEPKSEPMYSRGNLVQNDWEFWGMAHFVSMSGTAFNSGATTNAETSIEDNFMDFSLGVEKYFDPTSDLLKNISATGFINRRNIQATTESSLNKSEGMDLGLGFNYHFYNKHYEMKKLIGFLTMSFGQGTVSNSADTGSTTTDVQMDGTSSFLSFGVGAKYYFHKSFGARIILDSYKSSETFDFDDNTQVTRDTSGPRLRMGLSYRF